LGRNRKDAKFFGFVLKNSAGTHPFAGLLGWYYEYDRSPLGKKEGSPIKNSLPII
jgi:hypothetical protein